MKTTNTCPKCSGRKLFYIPEVHQPPEDNGWENQPFPFAVTAIDQSSTKHGRYDIVGAGPVESVVCATCGYTEWYASRQALMMLDQIAQRSPHVRVIQAPASPPYR